MALYREFNAFNIQWPTLLTLLMAPVLLWMYIRLVSREEEALAKAFGPAFFEYAAKTPAFIPWRSSQTAREMRGATPAGDRG